MSFNFESLPSGATLRQLIDRFGEIRDANNTIASELKSILEGTGITFADIPKLSELVEQVRVATAGSDSEFAIQLQNELQALQAKVEEDRVALVGQLSGLGYDIESDADIDDILSLLDASNISLMEAKQLAFGQHHAMIVMNNGSLYACGFNRYGQLGLGNTESRKVFTQVDVSDVRQVACGMYHTFIVKNDGTLWACGQTKNGNLGLNVLATTSYNTFTQVDVSDVRQVACSSGETSYTFIIKNDGSLWACGYDNNGQLGLNSSSVLSIYGTFTQVTTNTTSNIQQISCGYNHSFLLEENGTLWACGLGSSGQLGMGQSDKSTKKVFTKVTINIANDVKQVSCGANHTFIVKTDGTLWGCGANDIGQVGINYKGGVQYDFAQVLTDVKKVKCEGNSALALKNDGTLWGCGANGYGQLGLGNTTNQIKFTQATTNIDNIEDFTIGLYDSLLLKTDKSVWSCGYNADGQLGFNDVSTRQIFTHIEDLDPHFPTNDVILEMTAGKTGLVNVLNANEVEASIDETLIELVDKVEDALENSGGGLNIFSATELPATGKENQICIVSEHTDFSILVTTNYNEPITEPTHLVYLGNSASSDLTLGTQVQIGNIIYYFNKVMFGSDRLASYMWSNNQWNELTKKYIPLFENQAFMNTEFSGTTGVTTTSSYAKLMDDLGENVIAIVGTNSYYRFFTFSKKINFTNFTKLKVTAKSATVEHKSLNVFAHSVTSLTTSPQYTSSISYTYKANPSINAQNYTELTIDISSWTGELYLTFSTAHQTGGGVFISHISLE